MGVAIPSWAHLPNSFGNSGVAAEQNTGINLSETDFERELCCCSVEVDCNSGHPCTLKLSAHCARSRFLRHGILQPCPKDCRPGMRAEERIGREACFLAGLRRAYAVPVCGPSTVAAAPERWLPEVARVGSALKPNRL